MAVASLLQAHGAQLFLSDRASLDSMRRAKGELDALGIAYEFGVNSPKILESDILVMSPGIPSDLPIVKDALALGKVVISEIEVASWFCPGPILAITGTNGKTTTTTLLGRIFEDAKRPAAVAGNIGTAFSQAVGEMTLETVAILEISSFQLDHIGTFRPHVAALLNITPDHLDRYDRSFANYIESKCRIFENQSTGDFLVYNYDDEVTRTSVQQRVSKEVTLLPFSQTSTLPQGAFLQDGNVIVALGGKQTDVVPASAISIRGAHNLYNAMAAMLAARATAIPTSSIRATLKNFKGVEHRLEFVRELSPGDSRRAGKRWVWRGV